MTFIKPALQIIFLTIVLGPGTALAGVDKSAWQVLRNKYGWEITVPTCWKPFGYDLPASESTHVEFEVLSSCPSEFRNEDWHISVLHTIQVELRPPEERIRNQLPLTRKVSVDAQIGEKLVQGKNIKGIFAIQDMRERGRTFSVSLYSVCDGKNIKISAAYYLTKDEKLKPLSEIKLPPQLDKVLSSFTCKKP